ncbi:FAD-dependent oxidoreductase [Oceanobacillus chungangensis]|uniref:FAD-dependent oxidoreductase n=1 Tax=Oceanobacillus chungangensis TaxID=1229152 RepID=A0A3D8PZA9_9BACI|nr:FAD-dependent oxidoreductase [Oceanobacillus chungangensis]RDW20668.1 FAD-dependent oxidoreductase [Oceanobacillus chungangensis]
MKKDIAIIGGGIGGCLAALSAAKLGKNVVLTEETKWIGGQLTSQAVPPDEHQWIEEFGCTKTYRQFRNEIRAYYKRNYPLNDTAMKSNHLNPGNAWVSRIAHEPKVALKVLYDFLQPYLSNGQIHLLLEHKITRAEVEHDEIKKVFIKNLRNAEEQSIEAQFFLDATELGDLLPLAGAEYSLGAESKDETGEYHALAEKNPEDMQSITHVFALEYAKGENHTIQKPEMYDFWRNYRAPFLKHNQLSEYIPDAATGESKYLPVFPDGNSLGLWDYRRIIDADQFEQGFFKGDISLINWPQNDYWGGSIIDVSEKKKEKHLFEAKQLSLSLLYWLQTEAPRRNGGIGYPELKLRPDIVGTNDGLALHPYIRESRRIKALHTVVEEDINADLREDKGIKRLSDSVGIGAYRIDLHPTTVTNRLFYAKSYPFEIPLGSLIPVRIKNLIPACKNIGSTQITNGCFRVHPVEWNIGEAAGTLAAFTMKNNSSLQEVFNDPHHIKELQLLLERNGIALHWPEVGAI